MSPEEFKAKQELRLRSLVKGETTRRAKERRRSKFRAGSQLRLSETRALRMGLDEGAVETIKIVVNGIADKFNIGLTDLHGDVRKRRYAFARHIGCYLLRRYTHMTLSEIATFFGLRNHTTVVTAVRSALAVMGDRPDDAQRVAGIEARLGQEAPVDVATLNYADVIRNKRRRERVKDAAREGVRRLVGSAA